MDTDFDPPTPLEKYIARKWTIIFLVGVALLLLFAYYLIFVNEYVVAHNNDVDHFKHGSIGSETSGLPYWVFQALPVMYRDKLGPGGYRKFGLIYERENEAAKNRDQALPIGFSRRVIDGVERVWLNCAVCHMGTYRLEAGGKREILPGAPSNALRLFDLSKFFLYVGADPGFNADALIAAINSSEVGGNFNFFERSIYRYIVFPRVKQGLLGLSQQLGFIHRQEDWGPGRVDTFNPYKSIQFGFNMDKVDSIELNGSADYPSIWRQRPREGMLLHWDGNNSSVDERNLSAALGAGVTPTSVDHVAIERVRKWIWNLPAPTFPPAVKPNLEMVEKGRALYGDYCASCHGMGSREHDPYSYDTNRYPLLGKVTPLADVKTDPGRWISYTQNFAAAQNTLYAGYSWRFSHFKQTNGYSNQPLDGIWARSPYLHNGSVPTLRDLLEPAANRPRVWWRGSEILDLRKVGYRSDADAASDSERFRYDVSAPGNSNAGHDGKEYGTYLSDAEKDALVEYMKTL